MGPSFCDMSGRMVNPALLPLELTRRCRHDTRGMVGAPAITRTDYFSGVDGAAGLTGGAAGSNR